MDNFVRSFKISLLVKVASYTLPLILKELL